MQRNILFLLLLTAMVHCTISFVKDDELRTLESQYTGIYSVKKDINVTNDNILRAGTRIRLYFLSGTNSIKVYAYDFDEPRENALGKNILYLFESDFPENKFQKEILEKRISELLNKVK
ncbi:MAG: type II secretion system-associated lipoprotein [Spirochaetia bacterium]|nr:type II secretion system-associated lipoprotein [Spirochaetia bacterium]